MMEQGRLHRALELGGGSALGVDREDSLVDRARMRAGRQRSGLEHHLGVSRFAETDKRCVRLARRPIDESARPASS